MNNKRCLDDYPDVLLPDEAREILSIGRNMIYKLLKSGELKAVRIGKQYRIPKRSLEEFIKMCYS